MLGPPRCCRSGGPREDGGMKRTTVVLVSSGACHAQVIAEIADAAE